MIYGYIKVSIDKQDCANQKIGIEQKAKELWVQIGHYIADGGCFGDKRAPGCLKLNVSFGTINIYIQAQNTI